MKYSYYVFVKRLRCFFEFDFTLFSFLYFFFDRYFFFLELAQYCVCNLGVHFLGMKKIFLFLFLSVLILPSFSASLKGIIVDSDGKSPLQFVNVALLKSGSNKLVSGVITQKDGSFTLLSIQNGNYILRFSYVGYSIINHSIEIKGNSIDVGVVKLSPDAANLKEVQVVGQGTQMHFDVDKKVYSVDQNISAAGGSASDVLKNIPSVTVDNQGNVSLRSDGNVQVWINGKASGLTADNRAQILQQMPAEDIQSIEVMTNPSAKYNPEGSAGIINIVLKEQHKAGYYGSVSAGLIYPDGGKLGNNLGAALNYSSSKINAFANIGYRAMNFQGGGMTNRYNYVGNDTTLLNQKNTMSTSFQGLFMRGGLDYRLDTNNTIGFSAFGMVGSGNQATDLRYLLENQNSNPPTLIRDYTQNNVSNGTRPSFNISLDYKHDFDKKGSNLMASLSYSYHNRGGVNNYLQHDSITNARSNINQTTDGRNKELEMKVDYTGKLTDNSKIEAGWQSNVSDRLSTTSGFDSLAYPVPADIPSYFNNFNYNEQIHAAYLTYGDKFNNLTVQLGLRAELWLKTSTNTSKIGNTEQDTVQAIPLKSFFHIFPSFYLSYSLPENAELQFNYSNRVNRPRGMQINPFKNFSDSTNITYGNPDLKPQYSSALELNYLKSWDDDAQTVSGSVYYHYTDNVVQNVRFLHNGVMESTFLNVAKSQNTGLELISKNRLFRFLNLTSTLNFYYSKLDSSVYVNPYNSAITTTIPEQSNLSWTANLMANFMLTPTFSGQITAEYASPQIIAQGTRNASYSIDMGLKKTFFNRKISLTLMARDLLNSDRNRSTTSGKGFYQTSESYFHGRMFGLTLSYNFGNTKPKQTDIKKGQQQDSTDMMDNGSAD